jgi:hypothetical protein
MTIPMKYTQTVALGGPTGVGSYVFSVNSAYDPNVTSTGGSVIGFGPLQSLYNVYRVTASRIRVQAQSTDTGVVGLLAVAATQINTGTTSSAEYVAGLRNAKPHALRLMPVAGGGPAVIVEDHIKVSELLGDSLFDEANLYGTGGADPALQFYWTIGFNTASRGAGACYINVELEYLVEWSRPQDAP